MRLVVTGSVFGGGYRRSLQYAAKVKIPRDDDETGVTGDVGIKCAEDVAFRKASDVDLAPLTERAADRAVLRVGGVVVVN